MTTTKEKVLEAAKNCPQAKDILKTLFPEAFEEPANSFMNIADWIEKIVYSATCPTILLDIRGGYGELYNKSFWLSPCFHWEIKKDGEGQLCLIPTTKS